LALRSLLKPLRCRCIIDSQPQRNTKGKNATFLAASETTKTSLTIADKFEAGGTIVVAR